MKTFLIRGDGDRCALSLIVICCRIQSIYVYAYLLCNESFTQGVDRPIAKLTWPEEIPLITRISN